MVKNGSHRLADRIDSNEDFLSLLGNEKEPSLKDEFGEFHLTSGFRFIDLAILRKAIEQAQMCGCKMRGTFNCQDIYCRVLSFISFPLISLPIHLIVVVFFKYSGGAPNISLLELPAHRSQIGLATHLILRCSVCTKSTVFPNSAFSRQYPANYSINKLMLPLLGPASYYKLTNFLQSTERIGRPIPKGREAANLVLSIDNRR